jgi:integrase
MNVTYIERSPGVWRLRVEGTRGGDGKRAFSYETVHGTEKDVRLRQLEIQKAHEDGSWAKPDKLTFVSFFETWLAQRRGLGTITRSSEVHYAGMVKHAVAAFGGERLQRVNGGMILAVYQKMLAAGIQPSSVRQLHRVLRTVLSDARKAKLISVHPMENIKAPKVRKSPAPKALDGPAIRKLLDGVRGNWKEDIVFLALGTGLRRGELCGLRWCDVDLERGQLCIDGQVVMYSDGTTERTAPKTENAYRTVGISNEDVGRLRARRAKAAEAALAVGSGSIDAHYVLGEGERPLPPDLVSKSFSTLCGRIGLPGFTFHSLRHTHITMLFRGRADPKEISARVGHGSAAFTTMVYQTIFEEDARALADLSADLFRGVQKVPRS